MSVDVVADLVERDAELAEIEALVEAASAGSGRLLWIEGPAGIGKTRLVGGAREQGVARGLVVLHARGGELERNAPWGIARELLAGVILDAKKGERQRLLSGVAAHARGPLGLLEPGDRDGEADLSASVHGLYWLLVSLADRQPLLLSIDDAQWADPATLRLLAYLAPRLGELALSLLIAARPLAEAPEAELLGRVMAAPEATVCRPAALSEAGATELLAGALGRRPMADFSAACRRATGGNPFLLRELAAELGAEGVDPTTEAIGRIDGLVPEAVGRSVLLRLARLPEQAASLARVAAAHGAPMTPARGAKLARLGLEETYAAADALVAASIMVADPLLAFVHPLVRSAVYNDLAPLARARLHDRAARLLDSESAPLSEVSAHLLESPRAGDAWVCDTLVRAGVQARQGGARDVAVRHLRRALDEPPPPERRHLVLRELGLTEPIVGEGAAIRHLEAAVEAAPDAVERATNCHWLGRVLAVDRPIAAARAFERGLEALDDQESELARTLAGEMLVTGLRGRSTTPAVRDRMAKAPQMIGAGGLPDALMLSALALRAAAAGRPEAVSLAMRALEDNDLLREESLAIGMPLGILSLYDRLDEAEAKLQLLLGCTRAGGSAPKLALSAYLAAGITLRRGALREAEADARLSLDLLTEWGRGRLARPVARLVQALVGQGELERAEVALALDDDTATEDLTSTELLFAGAQLRLAQGRTELALADLRETGRRLEDWQFVHPNLVPWRASAAVALVGLGSREEAAALAAEDLRLARQVQVNSSIGTALRAAGLAAGGSEGIACLEEAVAVLRASPAKLELAHALIDLGSALRRAGRKTAAQGPLREGLDLAARCGASPLAQRAREELVTAGARPRRDALRGRDSLTASELRVARLAAEGMTNRQIAEALFITLKTVETHLSHAYGKLEIASRRELPQALENRHGAPSPTRVSP